MDAPARPGRTSDVRVTVLDGERRKTTFDDVVTEEPLELRLNGRTLAVTMRTPGNDFELAAGFVTGESLVETNEPLAVTYCVDADLDPTQRYNVVSIAAAQTSRTAERFERHFTMNSSCGICGTAQIDDLRERGIAPLEDDARIDASVLYALPERMRAAQRVFERTGALHAAGLFSTDGSAICVREDVGRHNAVDKVVGWARLEGRVPLHGCVLVVSGRTSYEIVQKAAVARIPIVAAVSAPSSLAIELARSFGITLAGFVRGTRANVYTGAERVRSTDD